MTYVSRHYPKLMRYRYALLPGGLLVLGSGFAPAAADPRLFAALLLRNMLVGTLVFWEEWPLLLLGRCSPWATATSCP